MLNRVMLIGRLGKNPELRFTEAGTPIANFSLATERTWRDETGQRQSEVDWHNIVCWGRLGEIVKNNLAKGRLVYVEGRLQTRSWEDTNQVRHYRTEVVAEQVKFLERKAEDASAMPEEELPLYTVNGYNFTFLKVWNLSVSKVCSCFACLPFVSFRHVVIACLKSANEV